MRRPPRSRASVTPRASSSGGRIDARARDRDRTKAAVSTDTSTCIHIWTYYIPSTV